MVIELPVLIMLVLKIINSVKTHSPKSSVTIVKNVISECLKLKKKNEVDDLKPFGLICDTSDNNSEKSKFSMKIYEPFLSNSYLGFTSNIKESVPIQILWDTGANSATYSF